MAKETPTRMATTIPARASAPRGPHRFTAACLPCMTTSNAAPIGFLSMRNPKKERRIRVPGPTPAFPRSTLTRSVRIPTSISVW